MSRTAACLSLLLASILATGVASAGEVDKSFFNHAVSACQPALPAFDGMIRKRPKAIANEGGTTAFVSCAMGFQENLLQTVGLVRIHLVNRGTTATTVNCTLVDGIADDVFSATHPKSLAIAAGARTAIGWQFIIDNGNVRYSLPAVSCALPPRVEIAGMQAVAVFDIVG